VTAVFTHPGHYFCAQYAYVGQRDDLDFHAVFGTSSEAYSTTGAKSFADDATFGVQRDLADFSHEFVSGDLVDLADRRLSYSQLRDCLANARPDILVIYGYASRISRFAWRYARKSKTTMVYISDSEDRGGRFVRRFKWIRKPVERLLLKSVDAVFTIGTANREYYLLRGTRQSKMYNVPLPIVRTPIDQALVDKTRGNRWATEQGLDGYRIILSGGKFVEKKRFRDILSAVALIQRDDLAVVLFGSGPDRAGIQEFAAHLGVRLHFTGFVRPADIPDLQLAAELYVQASSLDPHPLVVSEAVYAGLPVIVSDLIGSWGPTDDVRPGLNGETYRCGDVAELAQKIALILDNPIRQRRYAAASRKFGIEIQQRAFDGFAEALVDVFNRQKDRD
jgi:glycosyltransferase involved in cell wall biosynthesis